MNPVQYSYNQAEIIIPNGPLLNLHPDQEMMWNTFQALNNSPSTPPNTVEREMELALELERKLCLKTFRKTKATPQKSAHKSQFSLRRFIEERVARINNTRQKHQMTWEEAKAKYRLEINHLLFQDD